MLVKIGDAIVYSGNEPIAVLFTDDEKELVANMGDSQNIFCSFPTGMDPEKVRNFMKNLANKKTMEG